MLANFFGKSKPVNFIVLFALFLSYFSVHLFSTNISLKSAEELLGFLIVFGIFNFIIAKNNVTFDNSYAFLFFVLLIGFFPDVIKINPLFLASLSILFFSRKIYSLQVASNKFYKLFDAGLWLGISFLLAPYTAFFALLLYTAIYVHQQITYQTILLPLLGFGAVLFLFFTYCFWVDETFVFLSLFDWNLSYNIDFYQQATYLFPLLFIGIVVFYALLLKSPKALSVLNTFKKNWILLFIHLLISSFIIILTTPKTGTELLLMFFPVSIILANGLELFQKKWISDAVILLFLLGTILMNIL
ncbi:DUF6427 family protein [Tenacibaculum piscium]|uniref:DUF6427 family protein n=1 Tax=Tenacibaculum piscium TaxID=1458515 RepID=UPI001F28B252|nr:DUF6427 family protein [Tenacibaculum piscium]